MIRRKKITPLERTKKLVYVALFAALTAVLSQIGIPLPSGVPLTLQTFAVAAAGFFLGRKYGVFAVAVYIALGACGAPVFAGFTGGAYKLVSLTGGFVWGFLPLVALTGSARGVRHPAAAAVLSVAGVAACHLAGVGQYSLVAGTPLLASAAAVSLPYIAKDVLSVLLAWLAVDATAKRMSPFASSEGGGTFLKRIKHLS